MSEKISVYVELVPEKYLSNMGITISCKESEKWRALEIFDILKTRGLNVELQTPFRFLKDEIL